MMAATLPTNSKQLGDLLPVTAAEVAAINVTGIELDSRKVVAGDVFLAYPGAESDGRNFIAQAVAAGAVAVLAEADEHLPALSKRGAVPIIAVSELAKKVSAIADNFYDHPSARLPVLAVTGTNGKTSCTQLALQILNRLGKHGAVIGTLGTGVDGCLDETSNTTPDAITIQSLLAQWHEEKVDLVAMEASSHGLEQHRLMAVAVELALFTNLSRDHLDYHGTMQAYADAKAILFRQRGLKTAVLNADDPFSEQLVAQVEASVKLIRYSLEPQGLKKRAGITAEVWVENIAYHSEGVSALLHTPWGHAELNSPLLGQFNLGNLVAVIASLAAMDYPFSDLVAVVPQLSTVTGRMQRVPSDESLMVVVDYAHTPDALEKALLAMRLHCAGKIWCVFGCGGDRDQGKRPLMGEVAQRFSDHVIVTSDNPRNEPAGDIINEILGGVDRPTLIEEDRAIAIAFAISKAAEGDGVLIAGKGHEEYQLVGNQSFPFSDIAQARLALKQRDLQVRKKQQRENPAGEGEP